MRFIDASYSIVFDGFLVSNKTKQLFTVDEFEAAIY